jgi:PAS domain-containing protein
MKAVDKFAQKLEALHNLVAELLQSNRESLPEQEQLTRAFDELYSALKEIEVAEQQLCQQNNERFRLLVEDVKDYAIFTLDPNGYINSWNLGAERILGFELLTTISREIPASQILAQMSLGLTGSPQAF